MSADVRIGNAAGCRVYSPHARTASGQHHAVNYLRLTLVGALEAMLSVVSWVPAPAGRLRGRLCSGRGCEANLFGARVTPEGKTRPKQDCPDANLGKTAGLCLSSVQPCRTGSLGLRRDGSYRRCDRRVGFITRPTPVDLGRPSAEESAEELAGGGRENSSSISSNVAIENNRPKRTSAWLLWSPQRLWTGVSTSSESELALPLESGE